MHLADNRTLTATVPINEVMHALIDGEHVSEQTVATIVAAMVGQAVHTVGDHDAIETSVAIDRINIDVTWSAGNPHDPDDAICDNCQGERSTDGERPCTSCNGSGARW